MKLSVIYDSKTGNTKQAAEWIAEGMRSVEGVQASAFGIHEVDEDYVKDSCGAVIGCPSYAASLTPDMRTWLMESSGKLGLEGKLGGAFATAQYTHGGAELVVQSLLVNELVLGMLCFSGGRSFGKPIIHIGPVAINGNVEEHNGMEHYKELFRTYGRRFAVKAEELFGK